MVTQRTCWAVDSKGEKKEVPCGGGGGEVGGGMGRGEGGKGGKGRGEGGREGGMGGGGGSISRSCWAVDKDGSRVEVPCGESKKTAAISAILHQLKAAKSNAASVRGGVGTGQRGKWVWHDEHSSTLARTHAQAHTHGGAKETEHASFIDKVFDMVF